MFKGFVFSLISLLTIGLEATVQCNSHPHISVTGGSTDSQGNATAVFSQNWSGYAVPAPSNKTFNHVSGSWIVPEVTVSTLGETAFVFNWVGMDGFTSSTVEQIGTAAAIDGTTNEIVYFAWFEFFPAGLQFLNLAIHPKDKIHASVTYDSEHNKFLLYMKNLTTDKDVRAEGVSPNALRNSAEFIVEAPSIVNPDGTFTIEPLAKFDKALFHDCFVQLTDECEVRLGGLPHDLIIMYGKSTFPFPKSAPFSLRDCGKDFVFGWVHE